MKYENLRALKSAYDSGELHPDYYLLLDNDCSSVWAPASNQHLPPESDEDGTIDDTDWERVYEGPGPERLREEALTMLGIPWEGA